MAINGIYIYKQLCTLTGVIFGIKNDKFLCALKLI